ncbi:MAG: hypothetical protein V1647_04220 [Pseudomonadota bacterium]
MKVLLKNSKGQATVEYLLLLVVVAVIFWKVIGHVQDVFYGWGGSPGAIERFIQNQVVAKLESNKGGW